MKKITFLIMLLVLSIASDSYSQYGNSRAIVNTNFNAQFVGRNVTFAHCNEGVAAGYAGVIPATLDGVVNTPFYCLDVCTPIALGDTIKDSASSIPQAIYITNTYYPSRTTYPGKLANNNDEGSAVQLAIWHFRNNVDPDSITAITGGTVTVADFILRVKEIIADVNLNGGSTIQVSTLEIKPGSDPDDFYIETLDTAGNPIAVASITLAINGTGTLSQYTVSTNAFGVSDTVTVTGASSGDVISASATLEVPGGTTYSSAEVLNPVLQLLVLGRTTTAIRSTETTWGALPVELSSFTAGISGNDIMLNWSTSSEINNSGFEIERYKTGTNAWDKVGYVTGNGNSSVSQNYSFNDKNLTSGIYTYRLKQIDYNGNFEYHNLNGEVVIGVPNNFDLSQNYPNPFNPSTKIKYQIPSDAFVTLKVFDNSGKEVATLVNGSMSAGFHSINFQGSNLSSGVYFYKLETNGFTKVMKMALVK